jgi:hypothetical protein
MLFMFVFLLDFRDLNFRTLAITDRLAVYSPDLQKKMWKAGNKPDGRQLYL